MDPTVDTADFEELTIARFHEMLRAGTTTSAALTAWVEAHHEDDETKNRLCGTVPFPYALDDYPATMLATMWNQFHWGQDPELRRWIRASRLDGFAKVMAGADRALYRGKQTRDVTVVGAAPEVAVVGR